MRFSHRRLTIAMCLLIATVLCASLSLSGRRASAQKPVKNPDGGTTTTSAVDLGNGKYGTKETTKDKGGNTTKEETKDEKGKLVERREYGANGTVRIWRYDRLGRLVLFVMEWTHGGPFGDTGAIGREIKYKDDQDTTGTADDAARTGAGRARRATDDESTFIGVAIKPDPLATPKPGSNEGPGKEPPAINVESIIGDLFPRRKTQQAEPETPKSGTTESQTPRQPVPQPTPKLQIDPNYKFEFKASPGLNTETLILPSGARISANFPNDMSAGDTITGTVITEVPGKDEKERKRNQSELEECVLMIGGQPIPATEKIFTRTLPANIDPTMPFFVVTRNRKQALSATVPISRIPPPSPQNAQLPTCGQIGRNVVVTDHCDGIIAPADSCSIGGVPLQPLAESPRMRVMQNTSQTPGPTQIKYVEQGRESSGPFQNLGIRITSPNTNLLRNQTTTMDVVALVKGIQQDVSLEVRNDTPGIVSISGGDNQHFTIHPADVQQDGTYKQTFTVTANQTGAWGATASVSCVGAGGPTPQAQPTTPPPGGAAAGGATPPGPPPPRGGTASSECLVGEGTPYYLVLKKGPGIKHVEVVKPKEKDAVVTDDGITITWKTTSKTNDPVPLVVTAWDMDLRDYGCNCYLNDPSGAKSLRCKSLKKFYVVDVLNYVWSELPGPPGAFPAPGVPPGALPPGAKGKFLTPIPPSPTSAGPGAADPATAAFPIPPAPTAIVTAIVGPATLYQPPDLAEGSAPFTTLLKVEISDYPFGYGDDPPTTVIFKLEVVHHKDGYIQTVFVPKPKSLYETVDKLPTPPTLPKECPCQGEEKFEKYKIEAGATSDEVKACPGQKVVLSSKVLGTHKLTKICNGSCGHSEEESGVYDATIYSWTADGSKDNGSKVNGADKTDTNGWRSTVIYTAPTKPGEYTVTLEGKDSGMQKGVTNDPMKPKKITIKVYKLDLQVGKQSGKSGAYLTKEEVEKDGGYVALNADDDNENGIIDLKPEEVSPVKDENDLIPIKLSVEGPEPKDVTLKVTSGAGKIRVWETKDKTKEVKSDAKLAGREVSLDAYGHTFKSKDLPKELWVEAIKPSEKSQDVELTLELYVGPTPCPAKAKLTVLATGLNSDLDIDGAGAINEADKPFKATRGAYVVVNNDDDDRNGTGVDTANDRVDRKAADASSQDEKDLKRVNILTLFPAGLQDKGKIVLSRPDGRFRVYSDPLKGADKRILYSATAAGYLKGTEGNGRHTWDLSNALQRAAFEKIVTDGLWLEGLEPSGALRDTNLTLSYIPPDRDMLECDRMNITVVRFDRIRATIAATPPNTVRLGNGPVADHTFDNATGGIVYYLHENPAGADKNRDNNFQLTRAIILVQGSLDLGVPLEVTREPAVVPVRWIAQRSADDNPGLKPDLADPVSTSASRASMSTDATGSFLVSCYVDANANGQFDEGEPRSILPVVLIRVQGFSNVSVVNAPIKATMVPAVPTAATGVAITPFDPLFLTAANAEIHNDATVDVVGGGSDGQRGLDQLFGGWVNNELAGAGSPTVPQTEDVVSNYRDPAPPNAVHSRISAWVQPPAHLLFAIYTPPGPPPPPAPVLTFQGGPVLDTALTAAFLAAGFGIGGNTAVGTEGAPGPPVRIVKIPRPRPAGGGNLGERWQVEMWDSPGDSAPAAHEGFPAARLTDYRFNLDFRSDLVFWTNVTGVPGATRDVACRLYSTVQTNTWTIRFAVTFNAAGVAAITTPLAINLARDANQKRIARPVKGSGLEVRAPISLNLLVTDARR